MSQRETLCASDDCPKKENHIQGSAGCIWGIDPRTGFKTGWHGGYSHAVDFMLDHSDGDPANQVEFMRAWREGAAFEEWPEFYDYLRSIGAHP